MKNRFPTHNEDREYLSLVSSQDVYPVFVMGFHRSGTTFIYDSIARCFPLANLDLYSIFFYERLLSNAVNERERSDREWFNLYLDYLGIEDRGLDGFEVRDTMVEEYCWVLSKSNLIFPSTITWSLDCRRLREVCQKLAYTNPGTKGVLLKNPFDYCNAPRLLKYFPNAKFVYVKRRPTDILNSCLRSLMRMVRPHPFFDLMTSTQPRVAQLVARRMAKYWQDKTDDELLEKISEPIQKALKKKLRQSKRSLEHLPRDSYVVVDYETFTTNPTAALLEVKKLLNMEFSTPPDVIEPKTRATKPLDVTKRYAEALDACAW